MTLAARVARPNDVDGLIEALATESRLLAELTAILRRQREGIATDDLQVVDESVFASHRVMGTLKEAQRQRRALVEILTGTETTPLAELEEVFGERMPPDLVVARDAVQQQAQELAREIRINREVIAGAMQHGSRMIQTLRGLTTPQPEPVGMTTAEPAGALLDRCV